MGAFTNVVAIANSAEDFKRFVTGALKRAGFDLVMISDVAKLSEAQDRSRLHPDLLEAASQLIKVGDVGWGTFHAYDQEEVADP